MLIEDFHVLDFSDNVDKFVVLNLIKLNVCFDG